ncbi:MAG: hypothetical protein K5648_00230 [Erysipelotrichaceae bacterium]|nr:hypothetical protein [Erysipelotrichaceae bacterium]
MKKSLKTILTVMAIFLGILAVIYLTVFLLAKQKKIFINKWFVDERNSIIGVDVSSYQADIDMAELKKQNVQFIYIKATEGSGLTDARFSQNFENAKKAGLLSGAYHFFSYDSPGESQAKLFIATVGEDIKGRLIPAVDVEYYGDKEVFPPAKEDVVRELRIFLETVEEKYGVKPLIYTRSDIYEKYLKDEFEGYKMWMSSLYTPLSWNYKGDWYLWQYLNRGELKGYSGGEKYIDLDILNKDKELTELIVK